MMDVMIVTGIGVIYTTVAVLTARRTYRLEKEELGLSESDHYVEFVATGLAWPVFWVLVMAEFVSRRFTSENINKFLGKTLFRGL